MDKDNTEEENQQIKEKLEQLSDLEEVIYFDKDQVWEIEKEKLGDAASLLEENGDNPYHAYFTIREKDLSRIRETTKNRSD